MRKLITAVLLLCASASAQSYTTVTATLMDSSAQVWANAQWTTEFQKPAGNNGNFNNQGHAITANQTGVANASGVFTVVLDNNLVVSPSGSSWKFTICPNASVPQCNTISITVFGTTQDVSTQINAILTVPVVNSAPMIARAYNDTEVHGSYGALYINSISNTLKQCIQIACEGSGWNTFGVSSNNPTFTGVLTVPCIKFNFDLVNDSTLCSQAGTGHINLLLPSSSGTLALAGSASPGNPTNAVQFNNSGAFGGDAQLTYDSTAKALTLGSATLATNASLNLIGSATNAAGINVHNALGAGAQTNLFTHTDTNFRASALQFQKSKGTQASPTAIASGDNLWYLAVLGYDGTAYNQAVQLTSQAQGAFSGSNRSANLEFIVTLPSSISGTEVLRLGNANSTNLFGINTGVVANKVLGFGSVNNDITQALDTGFSRTAAGAVALGNGTQGNTSGTLTSNIVLSGIGTSTSPVCPNGAGGALTTSGCSGGAGGTGPPAQTGTMHGLVFDNSTTFDSSNSYPSGFWSHLQGAFTTNANIASANVPPNWLSKTNTGVTGSSSSIAEDAIAQQGNFTIFSAMACYCKIDHNPTQIFWLAMSSVLYGSTVAVNPNATIFGFRWAGGTDTNYKAYVATSNVAFTAVDTGIAPDNNFHGFFFNRNGAGGIDYWIDNVKVATIGSGATGFPGNVNTFAMLETGLLANGTDSGVFFQSVRWWMLY